MNSLMHFFGIVVDFFRKNPEESFVVACCFVLTLIIFIMADRVFVRRRYLAILRSKSGDLKRNIEGLGYKLSQKQDVLESVNSQIAKKDQELESKLAEIAGKELESKNKLKSFLDKVDELMILRNKDLISTRKFSDVLKNFVSIHGEITDISGSLEKIKELKRGNYLDERGFDEVSDIILNAYYAPEIGVSSKIMGFARKVKRNL